MNTALNATAPTFQPKEPTMTKLRIVLALLVALVLPVAAEAFSDGCLPNPFPTTPVPPVFAQNVSWGFGSSPDRLRFEIWRESCLDGSGAALLLRVTQNVDDVLRARRARQGQTENCQHQPPHAAPRWGSQGSDRLGGVAVQLACLV